MLKNGDFTQKLCIVLLSIMASTACVASKDESRKPTGDAITPPWESLLQHYQSLGEHRSGTETDHATSRWLLTELKDRGVQASLQPWPLRVFHLRRSELRSDTDNFDNFPFWYPRATGSDGIQGPLVLFEPDDEAAMDGAVALVRVPPDQFEFHFDAAPLLKQAADRGARAAVVILNHPMGKVSAQNANRPWHQQELPLPALIVSEEDAAKLLSLASQNAVVNLVVDGQSHPGEAMNVLGKIERGSKRWVVISTPVSGWFEATNERGPGIAMWLQLAEWLADSDLDANVLLTALSGHELAGLGMQALVDSSALPGPESTVLWLHLGSGIAVKTPLLSAVSSARGLADAVQQTLITNTALEYWPEEKTPKGSEQYQALRLGYPVVGLFGADPAIHSRLDQQPRIDAAEYDKILGGLKKLIRQTVTPTTTQ